MKKVKAGSMIKLGYIMLSLYMLCAFVSWLFNSREYTLIFMAGSILWIVGILIWGKVEEQDGR